MSLQELMDSIEEVRRNLNEKASLSLPLTAAEVLELSGQLDALIVAYYDARK